MPKAKQTQPPQTLQVTLTGLAPTGEAVGRADGLVIFVPYGMPGETVEVELIFRRRSFARARLLRVLEPSPERVGPVCPHFGVCGGCDLQHMPYASQLAFKTGAVREQLQRIGGIAMPDVRACLPSPRELRYRNHIQLVLAPDGRFGYHAEGSHRVIGIADCPIAASEVLDLARVVRADGAREGAGLDARAGLTGFGTSLVMRDPAGQRVGAEPVPEPLMETVGGIEYRFDAEGFFQVNPFAAEALVSETVAASEAQIGDRVLDVYCGVGLFTVPLARITGMATGIELDAGAVRFAQENAARAGVLGQTKFVRASAVAGLTASQARGDMWEIIVADPPRAGIEGPALDAIVGLAPRRFVYVSCDPATLARDARALVTGGYTLRFAQPIDLFPQTRHVETVACFERVSASER